VAGGSARPVSHWRIRILLTWQLSKEQWELKGATFQIELPPRRIDVLTSLLGLEFTEAWVDRREFPFGPFTVPFLSKAAVIKNKRATGRPKDIADLDALDNETNR